MMTALIDYNLHLADNALLLGHRNSEWCGHGPVLEQDIAISNISLDLIGQARNFYQYAATLINALPRNQQAAAAHIEEPAIGEGITEDSLAYWRDSPAFRNCLLTELPKGDWAHTTLRQFFFSNYQSLLYGSMQESKDDQMAAIAAKSLKEVTYHLRWSSEWVIRLGDGTDESHRRMQQAIDALWPYTGELFQPAPYEDISNFAIDNGSMAGSWKEKTTEIFAIAGLSLPAKIEQKTGGKLGRHTADLQELLSEMQQLQRTYPHVQW